MTLIVGLRGIDGLVLAADSRGTIGDPRGLTAINDVQEKMFQLASHCGVAITGASEVAAQLIDAIRAEHKGLDHGDVETVVTAARATVCKCYDDWFQKLVGRMVRAITRPPSSCTEATVVA